VDGDAVIAGTFVTAFAAHSVVICVAFAPALARCRSSPSSLPPSGLASAKASLESASLDCLSCLRSRA
jgi:hypothetical protein